MRGATTQATGLQARLKLKVVPIRELKPRTDHQCPHCNGRFPSEHCLSVQSVALSPEEAAKRLGIKHSAMYELMRQKKIRAYKVGKLWRTTSDAVLEFQARGGTAFQETG